MLDGAIMYNNILLIPALNPDDSFITYVRELRCAGFSRIVAVDDGSREDLKYIFATLRDEYGCELITHPVNLGKGRALKDGFLYINEKYGEYDDYRGIITADSDGQHTVADVIKLNNLLDGADTPTLFLGSRDFDLDIVPQKSKKGNKITSRVFKLLYGKHIGDTQTGLRAISRGLVDEYAHLDGDRFEYEMNMLIYATRAKHNIVEEPIETVYINNNSETHFRPFVDSFKIYKLILGGFFKFAMSSILSMLLDQGLANLLFYLVFKNGYLAKGIARLFSAVFNFTLNRKVVFKSNKDARGQAVRYGILAVCQLAASAILVGLLTEICKVTWLFTIFSIVVDTLLFLISYRIQDAWVFKK